MDKLDDTGPGTKPPLGPFELNARRTAAAAVLGDYKAALASAPLTRPPGREWMLRLASVLEDLLTALDDRDSEDDELDSLEPYCTECRAWCGTFLGMEGWHHFTGDPAPGGERQLYDAGHEAVPAWCEPPGRGISPADAATIRQALADASAWRAWKSGGDRAADTEQASAYERMLRRLVTGQEVQ